MQEIPPGERLVLGVEFAMAAIVVLAILELVHIVSLGTSNSEIFAAISGLIGMVTDLFVRARTRKNARGTVFRSEIIRKNSVNERAMTPSSAL